MARDQNPWGDGELAGKSVNCVEIWLNLGRSRDTASVLEQRDGPLTTMGSIQNENLTVAHRLQVSWCLVPTLEYVPVGLTHGVSPLRRNSTRHLRVP